MSFNNKESKSSLLRLSVTSENEEFAIFFCKYLMNATSEFYIETKTKKALNNVEKLKNKVDSVRSLFNTSISKYASATDEIYNLNPALKSKGTKPIKSQIDVQANTALLTSLITNLEMSKSTLNNQTPLFQIIDEPIAPLTKNSLNKTKATIIGGFLGFFFITSMLLTIAFFKNTI